MAVYHDLFLDLLNSGTLVRLAITDTFFCTPIGLNCPPGSCEAYNSSVILTFKFETFKRATQQKAVTSRWLKYKQYLVYSTQHNSFLALTCHCQKDCLYYNTPFRRTLYKHSVALSAFFYYRYLRDTICIFYKCKCPMFCSIVLTR